MATTPSIAMIPSGYKDEKVYSVLPTNGDGDFTFARTSTATRVNSNGLIEEVGINKPRLDYSDGACPSLLLEPTSTNKIQYSEEFANGYWTKNNSSVQGDPSTEGTEEVTNGDFATDSDWTKSAGVTIGGSICTFLAVASTGSVRQAVAATTAGKMFKVEYEVLSLSAGAFNVTMNGQVNQGTNATTIGIHTDYIVAPSLTTTTFGISAVSTTTGSIDNLSVKEVQGFVSPSGDTSAFKVNGNSVVDNSGLSTFFTITAGVQSYSIFAKKGEINILQVGFGGTFGDSYANVNLTNGVVEVESGQTTTVSEFSNGWYRITSVATATAGSGYWFLNITDDPSMGRNGDYIGNGTDGLYLFGAQTEQQSYATSYIKNEGDANGITRAADSANGSGDATVINSTEGTLYFEGSALADEVLDRRISLSDGTLNNYVSIGYSRFTGSIVGEIYSGGVLQNTNWGAQGITQANNNKFALSWGGGTMKFYLNGTETNTESATSPIGMDSLDFTAGDSSQPMFSNTKDLRVYTTALSNEELETLTTI